MLVPNGLSVGHKRIDVFSCAVVSRVRIVVTESVGQPLISRLAAFNVEGLGGGHPVTDSDSPTAVRVTDRTTGEKLSPGEVLLLPR